MTVIGVTTDKMSRFIRNAVRYFGIDHAAVARASYMMRMFEGHEIVEV